MRINVQCYGVGDGGKGSIRNVLQEVLQKTPPSGCYSFSDGVLHLAPEDVSRFHTFVVRLWAHPAGIIDAVEYEIQSRTLTLNEPPRRIAADEDNEETRG